MDQRKLFIYMKFDQIKELSTSIFLALLIVVSVAFFFGFYSPVMASSIFINAPSGSAMNGILISSSGSPDLRGSQEFVAPYGAFVTGYSFYVYSNGLASDSVVTVKIGGGRCNSGSSPAWPACGGTNLATQYLTGPSITTGWNYRPLNQPFWVASSTRFYIQFSRSSTGNLGSQLYQPPVNSDVFNCGGGYYSCDVNSYGKIRSWGIRIYTDGVTPTNSEYEEDPSLVDTNADFNYAPHQLCFLDSTCNIWATYNRLAIGSTLYIIPWSNADMTSRNMDRIWPQYAIASTTLTYTTGLLQKSILIPNPATATTSYYCFYLLTPTGWYSAKCNTTVDFVDNGYFDENFAEYDLNQVCDDVATSTGYFDEFRYSIECGFRKLVFWGLAPNKKSIGKFTDATSKIQRVFPFNTYFDLTREVKDTLSTTTDQNGNLGIPFIRKTATTTNYYILPVISSTSMPNLIGASNTNLFRTTLGYILWLATGLFCIFIFKSV